MERYYHYYSEDSNEIQRASTNPSTPKRRSDVDFNDVFGGPPRRSSVNEMRERMELSGESEEGSSCPWPPVFGGGDSNGNRRRYPNTNRKDSYFFDDIFGGDESPTPRKRDKDPFSGSCSPAPPLPLPVASSSLPSPFRFSFFLHRNLFLLLQSKFIISPCLLIDFESRLFCKIDSNYN